MPSRNEEHFKDERAAFDADMAAARAALTAGQLGRAVDLVVSPAHEYWYGKDPLRFEVFRDLYKLIADRSDQSICPDAPWQAKLMAELYSVWPKVALECATLRHSFAEPDTDDLIIGAAESVQVAPYAPGLSAGQPVALSQGEVLASAIGRDSSHVLFAQSWTSETGESRWSTSFRETLRRISSSRWTHAKADYTQARYYKVSGEVVSVDGERTIEVDRKSFEENPIKGEVLPPREFKKQTKRYLEYLSEVYSAEEVQEILENEAREKQHEKEIVRIKQPQTLTLAHEAIEGFLPAGTTSFIAEDGFTGPKVSDLWSGSGRITATVAVVGDEAWLENIIVPGHGLKGMYGISATTPITAVCISSDGALGLRNGNGESFGIWNLWTGDCLRWFEGHTERS